MIRALFVLVVLTGVAGIAFTSHADKADLLGRALAAHEKIEYPSVAPYRPAGMSEAAFQSIRISNARKQLAGAPSLATVVAVQLSETSDTRETVITLYTVDGGHWSLWTKGQIAEPGRLTGHTLDAPVRAITAY